jgi:hypothetical protein
VTTRDLFIYDEYRIGAGYYATASEIAVHLIDNAQWTGTGSSAEGKRIVNPKRETPATAKPQHGVHLMRGALQENRYGRAEPEPGVTKPGPPVTNLKCTVDVQRIQEDFPASWQNKVVQSITAHEIGHASSVPHHGSPASPTEWDGLLCVMRCPFPMGWDEEDVGTDFCTEQDKCQSKIDVRDP